MSIPMTYMVFHFISRNQQKCTYNEGQDENENDQQYIHHPHLGTPHLKEIKLTLSLFLASKLAHLSSMNL